MLAVIAACEHGVAHKDWRKLRELPYDDIAAMQAWIQRPFIKEPPKVSLAGLWFGLFNPIYKGEVVADIYLSGSSRFSDNEEELDWAYGREYFPEARNAHSSILSSIYRIAYSGKRALGSDAEWPLCLAYGAFLVKWLLSEVDPRLILQKSSSVGVAVGFDSGDFILLGKLSRRTFGLRSTGKSDT